MKEHLIFNRHPIQAAGTIEQPTNELVKNTMSLWNASVEDALKYGGDLTRAALGAMKLRNDRKHVVVDTKIHMLIPGMYPAIPSWHTDGVPRQVPGFNFLSPAAKGAPVIHEQENSDRRPPRFHLLVTGEGCLTEFLHTPMALSVPAEPTTNLYKSINEQVEGMIEQGTPVFSIPTCTVWEWDWWQLHRGVKAQKHEWRFLIRVTETDDFPPNKDLREVIRTQQQVYMPESFGW